MNSFKFRVYQRRGLDFKKGWKLHVLTRKRSRPLQVHYTARGICIIDVRTVHGAVDSSVDQFVNSDNSV